MPADNMVLGRSDVKSAGMLIATLRIAALWSPEYSAPSTEQITASSDRLGAEIVQIRVCRERGEPLLDISNRLCLVESTLAGWLRADSKELAAGFRSVSIVASEEHHQPEIAGGPLRLLTPAGYVIDGLDAQTLAFLLRVVG